MEHPVAIKRCLRLAHKLSDAVPGFPHAVQSDGGRVHVEPGEPSEQRSGRGDSAVDLNGVRIPAESDQGPAGKRSAFPGQFDQDSWGKSITDWEAQER